MQTKSDLLAVSKYAQTLDSHNGKIITAGFCWG
jgi:dienelactone hydrolase